MGAIANVLSVIDIREDRPMIAYPRFSPLAWDLGPTWLTVDQAAALSGHSKPIICMLILDGCIEAKYDGHTWLIDKEDLYQYQLELARVWQWMNRTPPTGLQPQRQRK